MSRLKLAAGLAGAVLLATSGPARADAVADFYKGKTVTVVSPSGTGGSIYKYALLVADHIGRHIPGGPTSIVEDRGGGGGVKAANYMAKGAPEDGTVIAELHPSSMLAPMMRDVAFDPRKFQWLGSVVVRTYVGAVWHDVPYNSLAEAKGKDLVFGGSGKSSASYQNPVFMAHLAGVNLKVITGYKSGGATNLAMERGEVQGRGNYYQGFLATNPDWIRDKKVKILFKMGPEHPDLANVAAASTYAKSDIEKQMLKVLQGPLDVGQAFYVPAGVPADRVAALRKAFDDMLADPEFQAEAKKLNLFINPRNEKEVSDVVNAVYETPQNVIDELTKIIGG